MNLSTVSLVVYTALGLGVTSAHAGPCGDEIAQLEKALRQSESNPVGARQRRNRSARSSAVSQLRNR